MKKRTIFVAIVGCILLGVSGAWAGEDLVEKTVEACKPEIETYCSQVTPGEGRILACFYAHEDKLSGRCSYALYEAAAVLEQFSAAITHLARECQDDLMEHCSQVQMGEGRVATCLLDHKEEVSEACSQAIDDVGLEMVEE
jgi:hypothetical protein